MSPGRKSLVPVAAVTAVLVACGGSPAPSKTNLTSAERRRLVTAVEASRTADGYVANVSADGPPTWDLSGRWRIEYRAPKRVRTVKLSASGTPVEETLLIDGRLYSREDGEWTSMEFPSDPGPAEASSLLDSLARPCSVEREEGGFELILRDQQGSCEGPLPAASVVVEAGFVRRLTVRELIDGKQSTSTFEFDFAQRPTIEPPI